MSSMFAFLSMIIQIAMPDHACSMTHHTDSMIACAWFNSTDLEKLRTLKRTESCRLSSNRAGSAEEHCIRGGWSVGSNVLCNSVRHTIKICKNNLKQEIRTQRSRSATKRSPSICNLKGAPRWGQGSLKGQGPCVLTAHRPTLHVL